MLKTFVKISNVTNLSDARYCAGMGVDMLGFSVDEASPYYIGPKKYADMRGWVAGVQLVAESAESDPQKLLSTLGDYDFDALQIENPDLLLYLKSELAKPLLLRVDVDRYEADELDALMGRYAAEADYFLLESAANAPLTDDWKGQLSTLGHDYPILLGFGLEVPSEVPKLADQLAIRGITLRGSEEIRPGFKDFGALMNILEALEVEH